MYLVPQEFALFQDVVVVSVTILLVILFIGFNFWLRKKGIIDQYVTRKLIHLTAGPTQIISFFFYTGEWFSPYIASLVPGLFVILFLLIGTGKLKGERFVQSMSRSEDPKELLRGTFYYGLVGMFVTIFCWSSYPLTPTSSPLSIVVVATLAFGDGVADLFGRRINRLKFTIFAQKSIPGSISMLIFSLGSCVILFIAFGYDLTPIGIPVITAIFAGTIIEALSPSEIDNISISITVMIVYAVLATLLTPANPWAIFHVNLP